MSNPQVPETSSSHKDPSSPLSDSSGIIQIGLGSDITPRALGSEQWPFASIAIACRMRQYHHGTNNSVAVRRELEDRYLVLGLPDRSDIGDHAESVDVNAAAETLEHNRDFQVLVEGMKKHGWSSEDCKLFVSQGERSVLLCSD